MTSPTSDAAVRTARSNDVPAVAHVQAAVWRDAYGSLVDAEVRDAFTPAAFEGSWRRSLKEPPSPLHRLLVATAGDTVVGFAAIGPVEHAEGPAAPTGSPTGGATGTVGEIYTFGVAPDRRGAGHGSRLLNAAVDTLRAGDFQEVTMWLLAQDEATRAFVASSGLQPDGAWRDRVIAADGRTAREVRLTASLADSDAPA